MKSHATFSFFLMRFFHLSPKIMELKQCIDRMFATRGIHDDTAYRYHVITESIKKTDVTKVNLVEFLPPPPSPPPLPPLKCLLTAPPHLFNAKGPETVLGGCERGWTSQHRNPRKWVYDL